MAAPDAARREILDRVRAALRTARLPPAAPIVPPPAPLDFAFERATPAEWRVRFVAELRALSVTVHEEPTADAVGSRVRALVTGRRVLAWSASALPFQLGELGGLAAAAWLDGAAPRAQQAACELGLTGVDAAIAETGTLALVSSGTQPRTASLLPPIHIAVVRSDQIVPTLRACFERLRAAIPAASAIHFVTGPSRTADIELQLTLGVHGPGELVVVVGP